MNRILKLCVFQILIAAITISSMWAATPVVKIRVAQYANELEFSMPGGGAWFSGDKKGELKPGITYKISGQLKNEAEKKFHLMVGSASANKPKKLDEIENGFKNFKTHRHLVGNPPEKGFPDNRTVFIGVGTYADEEQAKKQQEQISSQGISSWIHTEYIKPTTGTLTLLAGKKRLVISEAGFELIGKKSIVLKKAEFARGYSWHGFEDRHFSGRILINYGSEDLINCIEKTDLEKLLVGIVPSEISAKAPKSALQAQAVAARGEMLSKKGVRHFGQGYDFCSEQHCQVYKGLQKVDDFIQSNIADTRGLVLLDHEDAILDAVYGANCGGHSASNHNIWTSNPNPHLQGVSDCRNNSKPDLTNNIVAGDFIVNPPVCWCSEEGVEGADKFRWKKSLSEKDWKKVEEAAGAGRIKEIGNFVREVSGRIISLKISGSAADKTILKELPIRRLFGGLRSSFFTADFRRDKDGFIVAADFTGAGWGHGVGMCQTGAQSMAKAGRNFKEILLHYFQGVKIRKLY